MAKVPMEVGAFSRDKPPVTLFSFSSWNTETSLHMEISFMNINSLYKMVTFFSFSVPLMSAISHNKQLQPLYAKRRTLAGTSGLLQYELPFWPSGERTSGECSPETEHGAQTNHAEP